MPFELYTNFAAEGHLLSKEDTEFCIFILVFWSMVTVLCREHQESVDRMTQFSNYLLRGFKNVAAVFTQLLLVFNM